MEHLGFTTDCRTDKLHLLNGRKFAGQTLCDVVSLCVCARVLCAPTLYMCVLMWACSWLEGAWMSSEFQMDLSLRKVKTHWLNVRGVERGRSELTWETEAPRKNAMDSKPKHHISLSKGLNSNIYSDQR